MMIRRRRTNGALLLVVAAATLTEGFTASRLLPQRQHASRLFAGGGGDRFSSRGSKRYDENFAVVGSWRAEETEIGYEIDRKVMIGRLPMGADAIYLRDVLADAFGPVKYVEISPKDVAFVVFETPEAAEAACRTSVRVKTGDYEVSIECDRFEPRKKAGGGLTVFVGNLPYQSVSDDLLARVFTEGGCDQPLDIRRPYPGIAYVQFGRQVDADRAVRLSGTRLKGRAMRIDFDQIMTPPPVDNKKVRRELETKRGGGAAAVAKDEEQSSPRTEEEPAKRKAVRSSPEEETRAKPSPAKDAFPNSSSSQEDFSLLPPIKKEPETLSPQSAKKANELAAKDRFGVTSETNSTTSNSEERWLLEPPASSAAIVVSPGRSEEQEESRKAGNSTLSLLAAEQAQILETTSIKAARTAALSAAAAWREARLLREENADLRARVPRRATWQPEPFSIRLGSRAKPGDVLRLRIDGTRDLELCVPPKAGPGSLLVVNGALQCVVPRGAFPGEPLAIPLPEDDQVAVVVVPPGKRPGSWLWVAYPIDCAEPPHALPPPQTAVILPPPEQRLEEENQKPFLLAPPANTLAVRPNNQRDELEQLKSENDELRRELVAMRKLLKTASRVLHDRLDQEASAYVDNYLTAVEKRSFSDAEKSDGATTNSGEGDSYPELFDPLPEDVHSAQQGKTSSRA